MCMPTYVYECSTCEKTFELEQRITEDPIKDCQCGSNGTVKRVIQPVGIAFKGSGFYVNDSSSVSTNTVQSQPASCASGETACACKTEV